MAVWAAGTPRTSRRSSSRSDLVVIVINVNSHGAVSIAKKAARRSGCAALIVRTCGPSRFAQILSALTTGQSFEGALLAAS